MKVQNNPLSISDKLVFKTFEYNKTNSNKSVTEKIKNFINKVIIKLFVGNVQSRIDVFNNKYEALKNLKISQSSKYVVTPNEDGSFNAPEENGLKITRIPKKEILDLLKSGITMREIKFYEDDVLNPVSIAEYAQYKSDIDGQNTMYKLKAAFATSSKNQNKRSRAKKSAARVVRRRNESFTL